MRVFNVLVSLLALAILGGPMAACSGAGGDSDSGMLDGEDGADVDPCTAAAPLWNEIWQASLDETPLTGRTPETNVMDVWGSGPDDIYAVGFNGTILHFDGAAWSEMDSVSEADLSGVWGYVIRDNAGAVQKTDVFAVGTNGTILRYNGLIWAPMVVVNDPDPANPNPQPVTGNLHDVWGIPAGGVGPNDHPDVVAVGADGLIVRYDGATNQFQEMRAREEFTDSQGNLRVSWVRYSPERLGGVFGTGNLANPLFVAVGNNGSILELSGATWTRNQNFTPPGAFIQHLKGVWGPGAWEIFATGLDGAVLRRDNNGAWHVLRKENALWDLEPVFLRGFWGFTQNFCGELPEVEQTDGGPPPEPPVRANTSWAIFVGWSGTVLMGHDGIICALDVPTANRLESIWSKAPRAEAERWIDGGTSDGGIECDPVEVIITGVNGTVLRLSNPEGR
jgi:hypothetical protein